MLQEIFHSNQCVIVCSSFPLWVSGRLVFCMSRMRSGERHISHASWPVGNGYSLTLKAGYSSSYRSCKAGWHLSSCCSMGLFICLQKGGGVRLLSLCPKSATHILIFAHSAKQFWMSSYPLYQMDRMGQLHESVVKSVGHNWQEQCVLKRETER